MKGIITTAVVLAVALLHTSAQAQETAKIGVYDSRAVAVAFAGSDAFNQWMSGLKTDYERARSDGNQSRVAELEAEFESRQQLMHMQAFSIEPVDNILASIEKPSGAGDQGGSRSGGHCIQVGQGYNG